MRHLVLTDWGRIGNGSEMNAESASQHQETDRVTGQVSAAEKRRRKESDVENGYLFCCACGQEVGDVDADTCPRCGHPRQQPNEDLTGYLKSKKERNAQ